MNQNVGILESQKGNMNQLLLEFIRYLFVGGSAFLLDTGVLFCAQHFLFFGLGRTGVLISTALGFMAGLIYNYILSILFVFKNGKDKVKDTGAKSFSIFAVIGLIGLCMTEGGMYLGMILVGIKYYIFYKAIIAAIVLIWNYVARKILIFK